MHTVRAPDQFPGEDNCDDSNPNCIRKDKGEESDVLNSNEDVGIDGCEDAFETGDDENP